ncbi:MAG: peptidoglycan editing factor PgeF [Gammaproteobacteria bacterium]|nr:peptidoglycan editing factor PgeF [Gammaproteobacteria bacterium]
MSAPAWLTPDWPAPPGVRAACTLRTGGVSAAPWDSLNLATHVGDDAAAVAENRRRVRAALALPAEPLWLEQVHGATVCQPSPLSGSRPLCADSIVVRARGQVCAIQVADCLPVIFATRDGSAVAAAHAGWRGLASGVLEATVRALGCPGGELLAWLGPAIGPAHFEVGDEVRAAFVAWDSQAATAFAANDRGRWQCDLGALARQRLARLGIRAVSGGHWCTYADAARFFSFRRDGRCGRMAALVWLESAG